MKFLVQVVIEADNAKQAINKIADDVGDVLGANLYREQPSGTITSGGGQTFQRTVTQPIPPTT